MFPLNKIFFCGTGAADYSKPVEGEEFRKYTHTLVNDEILIDMGANAYLYEDPAALKERFSGVKNVFITHTHGDHFSQDNLARLAADNGGIKVYVDAEAIPSLAENDLITYMPVKTGGTYHTDNGYTLHVFSSNHTSYNHHFVIDLPDGKELYYGLDGAWIMNDVGNYLRKHPADLVIIDCTLGRIHGDSRIFEHNSVFMIEEMLHTMRNCKMIKETTRIFADHLAKTLHPAHKEVVADLATLGMEVACDGLCIEF